MRLSLLPIPLTLALLSSFSLARSSSSLQPLSSSSDLPTPLEQLDTQPRLVRVKRQGTTGGGTTGTGGDTTTGGDSAAGGSDTSQAAASSPAADTATTAPATTSQAETSTTPAASTPNTETQQTTQEPTSTTPTTAPAATTSTTTAQQTTQTQQTSASPTSNTQATSTPPTATSTPTSAASSESSATSASSDSASSSSLSTFEVTFTSTYTNPDGSVGTSIGTLQSASAVPIKQNNSSNAGKVWGIVGGVVGGIVVILAGAFLIYRMTQRRFSNLDDNLDEIKWPELQPDGQQISNSTSTLKPLDTHRTGGAGIGDDGDDWDTSEPFMANGPGGGGGERRYSSGTLLSMSQNAHDASYEQLAMVDQGGYASQQPQGHYDPFLGPSSAPYPPPQNVYPPSPYTSSPSLNGSPNLMGSSSPDLRTTPMGAPGAGGAIREGSPPPRDMFAAADGFRSQNTSPAPYHYGSNYRGGPL